MIATKVLRKVGSGCKNYVDMKARIVLENKCHECTNNVESEE